MSARAQAVERVAQQAAAEIQMGRRCEPFVTSDDRFRADVLVRVSQILAGEVLPRVENPDD